MEGTIDANIDMDEFNKWKLGAPIIKVGLINW